MKPMWTALPLSVDGTLESSSDGILGPGDSGDDSREGLDEDSEHGRLHYRGMHSIGQRGIAQSREVRIDGNGCRGDRDGTGVGFFAEVCSGATVCLSSITPFPNESFS